MPREKMFFKGMPITSMRELLLRVDLGLYVFMHDKPVHPSFVGSMPYNALRAMAHDGRYFSEAIRNPAYVPPKPKTEETEILW